MPEPSPRKLAVILHADVLGSTGLVQRDETLAHVRIRDAFERFSSIIRRYQGTTHELRGDALVAEFARASDAVAAALAFQTENAASNAALADDVRPRIRIGISLGEVVIADGTVTGAGVVVAQRVEQLAEPDGVCITAAVHEAIPRHLPFHYADLGPQEIKGFDVPLQVYRAVLRAGQNLPLPGTPSSAAAARPRTRRPAWHLAAAGIVIAAAMLGAAALWHEWRGGPEDDTAKSVVPTPIEKPRIAVLPFANLSDAPEQEYFAEGLAEDIIIDLSQVSGLAVLARQSSFIYKGASASPQKIGSELGAQFILDGTVRRADERVRVTAQLVDTSGAQQVWAARYDRDLSDSLSLQGEIAEQIVSALSVQLVRDEAQRVTRPPTRSFEAYDLFLQGRRYFSTFTEQGFEQAEALFRRAISLDPDFSRAYSALATTLVRLTIRGESESLTETLERAGQLARKAVEADSKSPQAYQALGYVHIQRGEFDRAREAIERSIELAPGDGDGYAWLAVVNFRNGDFDKTVPLIGKAKELNPFYPFNYDYNLGRAYYALGEYEKAADALSAALRRNENSALSRLYLAASLVRLGRREDAEWEISLVQTLDPKLTLARVARVQNIRSEALMAKLLTDLREAGLAE